MRLVLSKGVLLVLASVSVTFVTTEIALPGEATREEVEALTGYAAERSREVPEHAEDSHLSDLLARLPVVRVRSRLLGEVVVWVADSIFASDPAARCTGHMRAGPVVYTIVVQRGTEAGPKVQHKGEAHIAE
jgi:hypothetical protein|tara:strand:+ start:130 stop:525 length:396 start_codon:yes stop_codon:yes gene_type:complete